MSHRAPAWLPSLPLALLSAVLSLAAPAATAAAAITPAATATLPLTERPDACKPNTDRQHACAIASDAVNGPYALVRAGIRTTTGSTSARRTASRRRLPCAPAAALTC